MTKTKDEIMVVYINDFKILQDHIKMNGHLFKGRVYLCLKSTEEKEGGRTIYRIFFNDDSYSLSGIFVRSLNEHNESWECDIEELDFKNIEKYGLLNSDIDYAIDIKNMSLDEVRHKMDGNLSPEEQKKTVFERIDEELGTLDEEEMDITLDRDSIEKVHKDIVEFIEEANRNEASKKKESVYNRDGMDKAISMLSDYIGTTFDDKYQNNSIDFNRMFNSSQGKGINIFNAVKYLSRYNTEGFEKSDNPKDLLKAAHYILIELNRVS